MAYDLYPAVDEAYQFPPEVRGALAVSPELRNTVIPMGTTARNNLTSDAKWNGRLIFNTNTGRFEQFRSSDGAWIPLAQQNDMIQFMTQTTRDNLPSNLLYDGKLILNTTVNRFNRYVSSSGTWVMAGDVSDLTELLATTGVPVPVTSQGATRGVSNKAARADHKHAMEGQLAFNVITAGSATGNGVLGTIMGSNFNTPIVAPASGRILVSLSGQYSANGTFPRWATTIDGQAPDQGDWRAPIAWSNETGARMNATVHQVISGLTPGQTYVINWRIQAGSSETITLYASPQTAAIIEVQSL